MPGVVGVLTGRRPRATSTPTTATRSRTGRSSPSTASASPASRSPPSPPRTRRPPTRRSTLHRRRVRRAAGRRHDRRRRSRRTRRSSTTAPLRPGLFHGLGELPPQPRQRLLPLPARPRRRRGGLRRTPTSSSRASTPSRPSTSTRWSRTRSSPRSRADEITVWSSCQHPFLVRAELADLFGLPLAVRVVVPYLGGGFGSKSYTKMEPITVALARKAGRPVRIANSVDESMVTTRRHGMKAGCAPPPTARRPAARPRSRAPGSTPAPTPTTDLASSPPAATPRPDRIAGRRSRRRRGRLHQHLARRLLPRLRRHSPAMVRRAAGRRDRPPCGSRPARDARARTSAPRASSCAPAANRSTPISSATSRRSPPLSTGDGRSGPGVGRGHERRAARRRRAPGLDRDRAHGGRRRRRRPRQLDRGRPGRAHRVRADRRRGAGPPAERVTVLGGDTRFTPYDRSTGASRSTTIAGLAVQRAAEQVRAQLVEIAGSDDVQLGRVSRSVRPPLRHGRRRADRARRGAPEGSGSYAEGPVFWEVCIGGAEVEVDAETGRVRVEDGDRRRRRQGDQPAAGRAPGDGRRDAGYRQRALRGDALR